jgi:hypothetical protein
MLTLFARSHAQVIEHQHNVLLYIVVSVIFWLDKTVKVGAGIHCDNNPYLIGFILYLDVSSIT